MPSQTNSVPGGANGFSCVYLTSSASAAALASKLLESAQIRIHHSTGLEGAHERLKATQSRVLLTDVAFQAGHWRDALRMAATLPGTALVVVSRLADERLWIGALERGAYDLILWPFRADELRRVLENAHFYSSRADAPMRKAQSDSTPRYARQRA
jgi:DNA-binding NtrC family response regulator